VTLAVFSAMNTRCRSRGSSRRGPRARAPGARAGSGRRGRRALLTRARLGLASGRSPAARRAASPSISPRSQPAPRPAAAARAARAVSAAASRSPPDMGLGLAEAQHGAGRGARALPRLRGGCVAPGSGRPTARVRSARAFSSRASSSGPRTRRPPRRARLQVGVREREPLGLGSRVAGALGRVGLDRCARRAHARQARGVVRCNVSSGPARPARAPRGLEVALAAPELGAQRPEHAGELRLVHPRADQGRLVERRRAPAWSPRPSASSARRSRVDEQAAHRAPADVARSSAPAPFACLDRELARRSAAAVAAWLDREASSATAAPRAAGREVQRVGEVDVRRAA